MKKYVLIFMLLFSIALVSCSDYVDNIGDYNVGEKVNSSVLESIGNKVYADEPDESSGILILDESTVIFWTRSGSKLHISESCRYLANAAPENICSGTYSMAREEGLTEICSACLKESGASDVVFPTYETVTATLEGESVTSDVPSNTEPELDEEAVLYWTVSGSKYHIYRDCQSLSGSDEANIKRGDIYDAKNDGKNSVCSFCLKKTGLEENELPWNTQTKNAE